MIGVIAQMAIAATAVREAVSPFFDKLMGKNEPMK